MVSLFLLAFLGCELEPVYKTPERRPRPPKRERAEADKPRPDMDTGEAFGAGLLQGVAYSPARPTSSDDLNLIVRINKEGKGYVEQSVRWTVNGRTLISQRDTVLRHTHFSRGDVVQATVLVTARGNTVSKAAPAIVVANTPPLITTRPSSLTQLDGFRVRAVDPDGGRVHYELRSGPPGLTIGKSTGVCRYLPSMEAEGGVYNLVIAALDQEGAASEWRMQVKISPGSESPSVKAKQAKARADWEAQRAMEREAAQAD